MKAEPTPRRDGRCVACPKKIPEKARRQFPDEPFCSTDCCRDYFGTHVQPASYGDVRTPKPKMWQKTKKKERQRKAA